MCRATSLTGFLSSKRMFCKSGFFLIQIKKHCRERSSPQLLLCTTISHKNNRNLTFISQPCSNTYTLCLHCNRLQQHTSRKFPQMFYFLIFYSSKLSVCSQVPAVVFLCAVCKCLDRNAFSFTSVQEHLVWNNNKSIDVASTAHEFVCGLHKPPHFLTGEDGWG